MFCFFVFHLFFVLAIIGVYIIMHKNLNLNSSHFGRFEVWRRNESDPAPVVIGRSTTAGTDWYRDAQQPGRALNPGFNRFASQLWSKKADLITKEGSSI